LIVIVASQNRKKIEEINNKFSSMGDIDFKAISEYENPPEIIEDGDTFRENALIKARETSKFTGEAALADDSGLVVDALNGEPGIYSARYGGGGLSDSDRTDLLLKNLKGIPAGERSARFKCAIAIVLPDGREFTTEGICEGTITEEKRGEKGFGYDPVFLVEGRDITMAEMDMDEKNRISHRAKALEKAETIIEEILKK